MLIAALLSIAMGVTVGTLGGGGSILTVPILVYALDVDEKVAIATSLLVVGITSLAAALSHARAGRVRLELALGVGVASMSGAFLAGQLASFFSGTVLLMLFGMLMLVAAVSLWRGRRETGRAAAARRGSRKQMAGLGFVVGLVTGLVGAGGGFLIVPALVLLGGLPMRDAIGTSLVVIVLNSAAGFAGHAAHVELDWSLAVVVTLCAVLGSFGGASLGARVPQDLLRRSFAVFVLAMALFIMLNEVPAVLVG